MTTLSLVDGHQLYVPPIVCSSFIYSCSLAFCPCLYQFLSDTIDAQDRNKEWVYIRRFERSSEELSLLMRFSSLNMRAEHWNRVVPIVDSFDDPDDPTVV